MKILVSLDGKSCKKMRENPPKEPITARFFDVHTDQNQNIGEVDVTAH